MTHWEPGDVAFLDRDPESMSALACEYVVILRLRVIAGFMIADVRAVSDGEEATINAWRLECDPVRFLTAQQKK